MAATSFMVMERFWKPFAVQSTFDVFVRAAMMVLVLLACICMLLLPNKLIVWSVIGQIDCVVEVIVKVIS